MGASSTSDPIMDALLDALHRTEPGRLAHVVQHHYADAGLSDVRVYVADLQQKALVELTDAESTHSAQRLAMHGSVAGWAYRSESLRLQEGEHDTVVLFVPIIDGVERLGVLRVETQALNACTIRRCQSLAAVVA